MGKCFSKCVFALITFCAIFIIAGCGGGGSSSTSNTSPEIRFIQAVPSEGNSNVLIDSTTAANVNYGASTAYLTETQGSHHIQFEPNGSSAVYVDQNVSLTNGTQTTMVASGTSTITGTTFTDESTVSTAGDASVRIINAAPNMGAADVYIVPAGTSIANVSATVSNLAFQAATTYQDLAPGSYEIFLTMPGTKSSFTSTGTITLIANQIRTFVTLDALGGGFTQLTLADAN